MRTRCGYAMSSSHFLWRKQIHKNKRGDAVTSPALWAVEEQDYRVHH